MYFRWYVLSSNSVFCMLQLFMVYMFLYIISMLFFENSHLKFVFDYISNSYYSIKHYALYYSFYLYGTYIRSKPFWIILLLYLLCLYLPFGNIPDRWIKIHTDSEQLSRIRRVRFCIPLLLDLRECVVRGLVQLEFKNIDVFLRFHDAVCPAQGTVNLSTHILIQQCEDQIDDDLEVVLIGLVLRGIAYAGIQCCQSIPHIFQNSLSLWLSETSVRWDGYGGKT